MTFNIKLFNCPTVQPKTFQPANVVQMQPIDKRDDGGAWRPTFAHQARALLTEQLQTHRSNVAAADKRVKREMVYEGVLLGASCLGIALGVLLAVGVLATTPVGWAIVGLAATGGLLTFVGMAVSAAAQRNLRQTGEKLESNIQSFEAEFGPLG
jgi:hypothetical protein